MFGDLGKMMKIAGQMRARLPEMQAKLASSQHSCQTGGGAVQATVSGKMLLLDLRIAPEALTGADAATIAELVKAAVAGAQAQAAAAAAEAMKELTGGMEIPGMEGLLG